MIYYKRKQSTIWSRGSQMKMKYYKRIGLPSVTYFFYRRKDDTSKEYEWFNDYSKQWSGARSWDDINYGHHCEVEEMTDFEALIRFGKESEE